MEEIENKVLWDFDEIMLVIGFGKAHVLLMLCSGLLLMFTTNETMGMAIIAPASQCDLSTNEPRKAAIEAAGFVGMITASYVWGYYSDEIGRRKVLVYSTASALICSVCSMLTTNYWVFLWLRFMTGLCIAGPGFAAVTYLGEFCSSRNRAPIVNYMCMFNGFAMMYCPGLAEIFKHSNFRIPIICHLELKWWRLLGLLYAMPGVLSLVLLLSLPESPKFLHVTNRDKEAYDVLCWVYHLNTGKRLNEDFNITKVEPLQRAKGKIRPHNIFQTMAREVLPLFYQPYVKNFVFSCMIMVGMVMVANGLGIWFTDIRNRVEMHADRVQNRSSEAVTLCDIMAGFHKHIVMNNSTYAGCIESFYTFVDSIFLGLTFIIEYKIFGLVLIFLPRKPLFLTALVVSGSCGLALPFIKHSVLIRILFVLFLSIPSVIINLLSSAVIEFIPTVLRGKALCICMMFGRMGAVLGTTIVSHLLSDACEATFCFFATLPFFCAVLGYLLPLDAHTY